MFVVNRLRNKGSDAFQPVAFTKVKTKGCRASESSLICESEPCNLETRGSLESGVLDLTIFCNR